MNTSGDNREKRYRIFRESDGLSGWCFGAFLNLAEEQGELRYTGEGMVMVYEE